MTLMTSSPPRMGSDVAVVSEDGENSWMVLGLLSSSAMVPMVLDGRWGPVGAGNQSLPPEPGRLPPGSTPEESRICKCRM